MSNTTPDQALARALDRWLPSTEMHEIEAIREALREQGYAVVPLEPTDASIRAAAHLDWSAQIDPTWREIYRAMIAASEVTP